ncbi:MAG: 16S rRNA (cytidine(1402)-2'-O)-methyltransferase [Betaproteobacteria bacterium]
MDSTAFVPAPATLYAVATPIGNLRDITLRALDVLRGVDRIAAEDTRVSATLLRHYGIATRLLALHEHNERAQAQRIVALLREGESIALISDAGTPGISDPGAQLVAAVRTAGFDVLPIPGASALTAAVSVTGWGALPFTFVGFLPARSGARRTALDGLRDSHAALVFYEAPHRIVAALGDLVERLGGTRRVTLGRELTKRFETVHESTLADGLEWLTADTDRQRGEFVLIVEGAAAIDERAINDADIRLLELLLRELPASRAARVAAEISGKPRSAFYERTIGATADDAE